MRLRSLVLFFFLTTLNSLMGADPDPALNEALRQALDPGSARSAATPWPEALLKADPTVLRKTLKEKTFLPVSVSDVLALTLQDPPQAIFRDLEDVPADHRAYLYTPDAPGLFPLVILPPYTGANAEALHGDAREWVKMGYGALVVPPRKVGDGWTAKPQEHDDILRLLRLALLQTRADPDRVYLVGFSRGGHASWDVGLRHAERFAAISPSGGTTTHEGGFTLSGGVFLCNGMHLPALVGHGAKDAEAVVMGNRLARDYYLKQSWILDLHEDPNLGHGNPLTLEDALEFFNRHSRKTWPSQMDKVFNKPEFDGDGGWIQALELSVPAFDFNAPLVMQAPIPKDRDERLKKNWATVRGQLARVKGGVNGQTLRLETTRVKKIRVLLGPELVNMQEPVTVIVNSKALFKGQLGAQTTTPQNILQGVWESGETSRIPEVELELEL
ncbi:MAG: hypothetical protein AB7F75_05415 [Planctomycetota bacterium]